MLQQHMEDTYRYLFETAHNALLEGGSFAPFGAGLRRSGEQIHTNVDLSIDASKPEDHISGLIAGFRLDDQTNGLIAAGLVFDGQMKDRAGDHARALCFHIEVANGHAVEVMAAYRRVEDGRISFDDPQVTPVQPEVFTNVEPI
ncbi:MAG: hypothetical protein ABW199_08740 [Caulobacterales bacterium]